MQRWITKRPASSSSWWKACTPCGSVIVSLLCNRSPASDRVPGKHIARAVEVEEAGLQGRQGVRGDALRRPSFAAVHRAHGPRLAHQKDLVVAHREHLA